MCFFSAQFAVAIGVPIVDADGLDVVISEGDDAVLADVEAPPGGRVTEGIVGADGDIQQFTRNIAKLV